MFGFIPTQFDGTEIEYTPPFGLEKFSLPAEYSFLRFMPPVIDQGSEPWCVPSSLSTWLNWKINSSLGGGEEIDNKIRLRDIFEFGRRYEEEDVPAERGMTFKSALKYLRKEGVESKKGNIKIYYYATINSHLHLKYALFMNGPCFGALPIYTSSFNEFWNPRPGNEELLGFHAVGIIGYTENGLVLRNSWGPRYGKNGYWEIPYSDFKRFIELWTIIK